MAQNGIEEDDAGRDDLTNEPELPQPTPYTDCGLVEGNTSVDTLMGGAETA